LGWVQDGKGLHGGQAQFVRVPMADSTLLKIPSNVSLEAALLAGDILSTGYYCALQAEIKSIIQREQEIKEVDHKDSDVFVVIGCGPVGLMTIIAARYFISLASGTEKTTTKKQFLLYAIDSVPERLTKAIELGADKALNYSIDNVNDIIKQATQGRGSGAVMEVVGASSSLGLAYQLIRPGGIISSVGVHTTDTWPFTPVNGYDKNITLKMGRCPARSNL